MNNLFDAFISYGRADSLAFGRTLYEQLLKVGLKIWFDQNDIPLGVDFQNQIDDGIEKAQNFLFIIAPHSVNSPYCLKEIELAIKRNKRIIPLLHVEQISRETWARAMDLHDLFAQLDKLTPRSYGYVGLVATVGPLTLRLLGFKTLAQIVRPLALLVIAGGLYARQQHSTKVLSGDQGANHWL